MKFNMKYGLLILLIIGSLCACSINKYIPENENLYTGASLNISSDSIIKNESALKDELEAVIIPEPNKSFLGMRPGLFFYYKNQKENPGFINRWLYKKLGEKPVYQSDVETYEVEKLLLNRLENRGFFSIVARLQNLKKKIKKLPFPTK